jgi:formylglycine-generating enzyme required for sulfatase activity
VQEYARFVDAGGYDPEGFGAEWIPEWHSAVEEMLTSGPYRDEDRFHGDRRRRQPHSWEHQLETPNRPIVNISWYEGAAYCDWLTKTIVDDTTEYRLPYESEWLRAALGQDGKGPYPWGKADPEEGNKAQANYSRSGIEEPTPVGMFPTGAADWGDAGSLKDVAGNVWEWCADDLATDGKPCRGGLVRPLRGGCYWSGSSGIRVSNRSGDHAARWSGSIGFRVVRCDERHSSHLRPRSSGLSLRKMFTRTSYSPGKRT